MSTHPEAAQVAEKKAYSYEAAIHMMPLQYGLNTQVWLDGFRTAEAAHGFGQKLIQQVTGFPTPPTATVQMPEEPPAAALGILIGYDSLEHLNDCDQEVLRNRARMRWAALREACSSKQAGDPA